MGIFGLGSSVKKPVAKAKAKSTSKAVKAKASTKAKSGKAGKAGNSDEAKAMLAKMQAKSDAGDCPFC